VRKQKSYKVELNSDMRIIAITSGKGGVGKTNLSVNLAINMVRLGKRVVVIDADFGLSNVEVIMGVNPVFTFKDVLAGVVTLPEALTNGPGGVKFLSGGSGFTQFADMTDAQLAVLVNGLKQLQDLADIVLIDTSAGMSRSVTNLLRASHEVVIVTTSDPTSIADAYTVIKLMTEDSPDIPNVKAVVNRVESSKEGIAVFSRLQRVCNRFLQIGIASSGLIPEDKQLGQAVKAREPVAILYPSSDSNRSIEKIAKKLLNAPTSSSSSIIGFMERWLKLTKRK